MSQNEGQQNCSPDSVLCFTRALPSLSKPALQIDPHLVSVRQLDDLPSPEVESTDAMQTSTNMRRTSPPLKPRDDASLPVLPALPATVGSTGTSGYRCTTGWHGASEYDSGGVLLLSQLVATDNWSGLISIYPSYGTVVNRCVGAGIALTRAQRQELIKLDWRAKPTASPTVSPTVSPTARAAVATFRNEPHC